MNQEFKNILKIISALISIALAAQLTIDIGSIPITGQTFAILFWAFFLSTRDTIIALASYLLLGFCGAPVFADGAYGIEKLYGGSGGFLIGFLFAAGLVSYFYLRVGSSSFITILGFTAFGTLIIILFGVSRLIHLYGFEKGIEYGLLPFWKGALVKIFIGSIMVWGIKKFNTRRQFKIKI